MLHRSLSSLVASALFGLFLTACGGSPTSPRPPAPPIPPPTVEPPANIAPTIDSIAVQGRRPKQPARFADLRETVDVTATVRDPETPVDELTYQWTATAGTVTGTGRIVTWTAPDATTPGKVTITLKVIESYGHPGQPKNFSQEVSKTVDVALHDSVTEVRKMSEQFLLDFSDTNIKDWQYIMRNFNAAACPNPGTVDAEKADVIKNYTDYEMISFKIGDGKVTVNFGGFCRVDSFRSSQGDACAVVPAFWDSRHKATGLRSVSNGNDTIAAAYSSKDARWYLCSSDYESFTTLAPSHLFYGR